MLARFLAPLLAALSSCQSTLVVQKAGVYDLAVKQAEGLKPFGPRLLTSAPVTAPGELVPYANVSEMLESGPNFRPVWLWQRAVEHRPDVVVYSEGDPIQTGGTAYYLGWGVSTLSPTYARQGWVTCFRASTCVLPFVTDNNMILSFRDGSDAKAAGLLEGDTVVSVDGASILKGTIDSPHFRVALEMTPEKKVRVAAVRPGTGRVEADVTPSPNPRTYLTLPDSRDLRDYTIGASTSGKWRAVRRNTDCE